LAIVQQICLLIELSGPRTLPLEAHRIHNTRPHYAQTI